MSDWMRLMRGRVIGALCAVTAVVVLLVATPVVSAASAPDANLVAARAAAARILALTPLPAGAMEQSTDQSSGGSLATVAPHGHGQLVDRHQYWTLSEAPATVSAYVLAHPPVGSSPAGLSGGGSPPYFWSEIRTFPGVSGGLTSEMLQVSVAAAPGGGSAVRADAEVIWRPTWEQIPTSSRAATVRLNGVAQRTVTGASLGRLRNVIDADPVVGPGPYSCPAGFGAQAVTVTFVGRKARRLARVSYSSDDGCGFLGIVIGARRAPALFGGYSLMQQLWSAGSLVRCAPGQLSVSVSRPSDYPGGDSATISIRNLDVTPCSLEGDPSVQLVSSTGRRLASSHTGAPTTPAVATASARTRVFSGISWSRQPKRCSEPSATSAIIRLPGVAQPFQVSLPHSANRIGPCHGRLTVSPVEAAP